MKAIVYTSNTGHTKQYAELLSGKIWLPAYDLETAKKELPKGSEVLYLGWLMAGKVKGYRAAARRFAVKAVCGVGMAPAGTQLDDIRKSNGIPAEMPVFSLQGGFEMEKLHGIYKMMMKTMLNTVGKGLSKKQDRTPDEDEMLELLYHSKNAVSEEQLKELIDWALGQRRFCQSCGMPMDSDDLLGREADGSLNPDYCKYCYDEGKFLQDVTMEEFIEMCSQFGAQAGMTNEEMKEHCKKLFPTLKRWKTPEA